MGLFSSPEGLRRLICVVVSAVLMMGIPASVRAEDARRTPGEQNPPAVDLTEAKDGYSAVLYDNRNGLPISGINDIARTEEGFLWLGSYAGLIRYDGSAFEQMDTAGGLNSVRCLYTDQSGRLWIGTNDNGVARMENGSFRMWGKQEGLQSLHIRRITEDANGVIYVATSGGIAMIDPEDQLRMVEGEAVSDENMCGIWAGRDGTIYGSTQTGGLMAIQDGRVLWFLQEEEIPSGFTGMLLPDPDAAEVLWLEGKDGALYQVDLRENFRVLQRTVIEPLQSVNTLEAVGGGIWICAENGIGVLADGAFELLEDLPLHRSVGHVMTDYQGNLWFTSSRQGLMKVVPNRFSDLFARFGLPETVVNATCMLEGKLFAATDTGLIVIGEESPVERLPLKKAVTASGTELEEEDLIACLDGVRLRSVIRDSRDRLWFSSWMSKGLLRYDHGELTVFTESDGLLSNRIRTVSECANGDMLAAMDGGVCVIRENAVLVSYGSEAGITNTASLTVCEGLNGEILLGTNGGGIFVIRDGSVTQIDREDGLPSDVVMRVKRDPTHRLIWIVTGSGVACMTPDEKVTAVEKFPYPDNLDLCLAPDGRMWVLSSNGIYVVSTEEMIANGELHPEYYGLESGLPSEPTANSYSDLTERGDLYIAGVRGVCRINVLEDPEKGTPLKMAVPYVELDGRRAEPDESGGFTVPYRVRKLTIHPYVFNYTLTDPKVTLRMDGLEDADTVLRCSRLDPVSYNGLPVGEYRFILRVENASGGEDLTLSVPIEKEPPLTDAQSGTLIMDLASLLFLFSILLYASPYMKRNSPDDRMFRYMTVTNIVLDLSEMLSYLWEAGLIGEIRVLSFANYTLLYLLLSLFMYFFVLHLYYRVHRKQSRTPGRRVLALFGIPLALLCCLMAANPVTGWIFTLEPGNRFVPGPLKGVELIPIFVYLAAAVPLTWKVNRRLVALGFALLLTRISWLIWFPEIASISLMYTMVMICAYTHQMNRSIIEEAA